MALLLAWGLEVRRVVPHSAVVINERLPRLQYCFQEGDARSRLHELRHPTGYVLPRPDSEHPESVTVAVRPLGHRNARNCVIGDDSALVNVHLPRLVRIQHQPFRTDDQLFGGVDLEGLKVPLFPPYEGVNRPGLYKRSVRQQRHAPASLHPVHFVLRKRPEPLVPACVGVRRQLLELEHRFR